MYQVRGQGGQACAQEQDGGCGREGAGGGAGSRAFRRPWNVCCVTRSRGLGLVACLFEDSLAPGRPENR